MKLTVTKENILFSNFNSHLSYLVLFGHDYFIPWRVE